MPHVMPAGALSAEARRKIGDVRRCLRELASIARDSGDLPAASTISAAADDVHRITEDALRLADALGSDGP